MIFFLIYVTIDLAVSYADVAESADAPDLGSGGNTVGVQVPSSAPKIPLIFISKSTVFFYFVIKS